MRPTKAERVLAELVEISDELEDLDRRREQLLSRRLDVFQRGRALDPSLTQREMAEACRLTDGAVTQALRNARLRDEAAVVG